VATPESSPETDRSPVVLVEFPADDPERARAFWSRVLAVELEPREEVEGHGWETHGDAPALGVHERGPGPGDRFSLAYFSVDDLKAALDRVRSAGGEVVHPGARWAVCRDSEGSSFGLAQRAQG
jgi:predicted enzyme related to lactoylglutathione lyase